MENILEGSTDEVLAASGVANASYPEAAAEAVSFKAQAES